MGKKFKRLLGRSRGKFLVIYLIFAMLILCNHILYEKDVYDCSNMAADQYVIFDKLKLEPMYVVDIEGKHAYLYLSRINVYWECTSLHPKITHEG